MCNKEATKPMFPSWSRHFDSFMVATMAWLIGTEYLCP